MSKKLFDISVIKTRRGMIIVCCLTVLVTLGTYLRMRHIGRFSLWTDEFFHVYAAKGLLNTGAPVFPSGVIYDRAILFTRMVASSFKAFGFSEFGARLPSVIWGVLMIPLVYFLGARMFNRRTGLLSAILVALSPFCILWSNQCRMYTLFSFLYVLAVYLWYCGFEPPQGRQHGRIQIALLIMSVLFFMVSYTIHELTIFIVPSLLCYSSGILIANRLCPGGDKKSIRKHIRMLSGLLICGVFYVAYKMPGGQGGLLHSFLDYFGRDRADNESYLYYFLLLKRTYPVFIPFFTFTAIYGMLKGHKAVIYAASMFSAPFVILSLCPSWTGYRYIFFVFPFFLILSAHAITTVACQLSRGKKVTTKAIIILSSLYLTFTPWITIWSRSFADFGIYDFKPMAATIRSLPADTVLIVTEPFLTEYYTGRRPDFIVLTRWYTQGYPGYEPLRDDRNTEIDINSGIQIVTDVDSLMELESLGRTVCFVSNSYFLQAIPDKANPLIERIRSRYIFDSNVSYKPFAVYMLGKQEKPKPTENPKDPL